MVLFIRETSPPVFQLQGSFSFSHGRIFDSTSCTEKTKVTFLVYFSDWTQFALITLLNNYCFTKFCSSWCRETLMFHRVLAWSQVFFEWAWGSTRLNFRALPTTISPFCGHVPCTWPIFEVNKQCLLEIFLVCVCVFIEYYNIFSWQHFVPNQFDTLHPRHPKSSSSHPIPQKISVVFWLQNPQESLRIQTPP